MTSRTVTIAIPVFNGAKYLREAVDSALDQTWRNLEVVVVNDGSDDNHATRNICLEYGDRIRYFEKENGGVASALNLAIRHMRAEYFSWLSHDDLYHPEKVERQIRLVEKQQDKTTIVFSNYSLKQEPTGDSTPMRLERIYPEELLTRGVFPVMTTLVHGCTLLIHRSHFDRCGLFDENLRIVQDYDLWFRILRGQQSLHIPECLVTARLHAASGTNTLTAFNGELGTAYRGFVEALSTEEVEKTFPCPAAMYAKVAGLLWSYGLDGDMRAVLDKAGACAVRQNDEERKRADFHARLVQLAGGDLRELFVFGAGLHGRRLVFDLAGRGIAVDRVLDNNPKKWGTAFAGIPCCSPEILTERKRGRLILIALRNSGPVVAQLRQTGCHCVDRQSLESLLLQTPPLLPELAKFISATPCN